MAKKQRKFELHSQREMLKALRYMGTTAARIEAPMLHPDHIKWASIQLRDLAGDLEAIAYAKGTNLNKVLHARAAFYMVNKQLKRNA